ncbi:hypothetical protein ACFX1T_038473 [Malus domestica]
MVKKQRLLVCTPQSLFTLFLCEVPFEVALNWGREIQVIQFAAAGSQYKSLLVSSGFVGFVVFFAIKLGVQKEAKNKKKGKEERFRPQCSFFKILREL